MAHATGERSVVATGTQIAKGQTSGVQQSMSTFVLNEIYGDAT